MKSKQIARITVDILMTIALLLLMAYSLVGEAVHEWLGMGILALFVLHHVLNIRWSRGLSKGRYSPFRICQIALVALSLVSMAAAMVSGVVLSRYTLPFLPVAGWQAWARTLHMLSAYWGFVVISLHLGLHWSVMLGMARRILPSQFRPWTVRAVGLLIAGYGVYAFVKREIGSYMFLKTQFVFFDFEEPVALFLLDYMAVIALFVCIGHYLSVGLKGIGKKNRQPR